MVAYGLYATMSNPYFLQAGTSSFSIALVIGLYIACKILISTHSYLSAVRGSHCITDLIDLGSNPSPLLAQSDDLSDLIRCVVAQSKGLETSFFVKFVHGLQGIHEWDGSVRCMEIEDVHILGIQCCERVTNLAPKHLRFVSSRNTGIDLCRQLEPEALVVCCSQEGLRLASNILRTSQ